MDKLTRLYKLHQILLAHRQPVPLRVLMERLECSRPTAARAIEEMRSYFGAPLEYVRAANGYAYVGDGSFQLPGFWLSERELLALLTLEQLVAEIGSGILSEMIEPFAARMRRLLEVQGIALDSRLRRVVLGSVFRRPVNARNFAAAAAATLRRKRLKLVYHNRSDDRTSDREISPQRLVHHRDNWYIEAWCHLREDLRTFALDRIVSLEVLDAAAIDVDAAALARRFETSFGIYSGEPKAWAVLRFSRWQATWTAGEQWHPDQKSRQLDDGRLELEVPYASDGEIIIDILGHVPHVEVVAPAELREEVRRRLAAGLQVHSGD